MAHHKAVVPALHRGSLAELDMDFGRAALHKESVTAFHTGSAVAACHKDTLDWGCIRNGDLETCKSPYVCYRLCVKVSVGNELALA